ncbi:MAG: hypothetical protein GY833_18585 [Aestuariibacter sp.]|nr:hypothetical protein [Aestuariibacter sp.]
MMSDFKMNKGGTNINLLPGGLGYQKQGPCGNSGSYYVNSRQNPNQQLHIHPHSNGTTYTLYENGKPIAKRNER